MRIESMLGPPNVIIDLSPIVMFNGPPRWGWVEDVVEAWRLQKDEWARFHGVADNSLHYRLIGPDQQGLRRWKQERRAQSVSWADPVIVSLATQSEHSVIITTDKYRDLRRDFPWLQETTRVWEPVLTNGELSFQQADFSAITDYESSMWAEEAGLAPKGLRTGSVRDALEYEWRCETTTCTWSNADVIEEDPSLQNEVVVCPACRRPASKVGRRGKTREIVVFLEHAEVDRLPIAEDSNLIIGRQRGVGRYDVRELLDDEDANQTSREHLKFTNIKGLIRVEDMQSKNGTGIIDENGEEETLHPGTQRVLKPNEILVLPGGLIRVRLSGKKRPRGTYAPDLTTPPFLRE